MGSSGGTYGKSAKGVRVGSQFSAPVVHQNSLERELFGKVEVHADLYVPVSLLVKT